MSEHTGIAVVWPAWFEGSTDPELHVTALFLGNTTDPEDYGRGDVQDVVDAFRDVEIGEVGLMPGIDMFGRNKDVPVIRLYNMFNPHLRYQRDVIMENLLGFGIKGSSEFGFNPHVTIAKEKLSTMKALPRTVHLEAPVLWWGDQRPLHSKHRQVSV